MTSGAAVILAQTFSIGSTAHQHHVGRMARQNGGLTMFRYAVISVAAVIVSNAASAKDLTAAENLAKELSAKTGRPIEVGFGNIGLSAAARRATQTRPISTTPQQAPDLQVAVIPARSSPSLVDLSAYPPGYKFKPVPQDPGRYSEKLEARSHNMFGYNREEERQKWMAEQEQREIANEINRSKPLIYPAR